MVRLRQLGLIVALLILCARAGLAQAVGTVAETEGTLELRHLRTWAAATIGTTVSLGDELRTAQAARARVVFRDESVLTIGSEAHVVVNEQLFDVDQGVFRTVIALLKGKVRPLVSEYYGRPGASYEVETPTAVAGVRGTEFVIAYDPVADVSEVVGVTGRVEAHSVLDRVGHAVFVTSQTLTTVARGRFPTAPQRIPDRLFQQYLEDLEFIGGGRAESMTIGHPLLAGAAVPSPDRAEGLPGPPIAGGGIMSPVPGQPYPEFRNWPDAGGVQPPGTVGPTELGIRF